MQSDLFTTGPDERDTPSAHTPGPYRGRVLGETGNIRLYSAPTDETLAYVLSREWGDYENAPDGDTAGVPPAFPCAPGKPAPQPRPGSGLQPARRENPGLSP